MSHKVSDRTLKKSTDKLPTPVVHAIRKLSNDLSLARRRRRISQRSLAERIGASLSTVRRMESADARVPLHFIAQALYVFGEIGALESLLDSSRDEIGMVLMDESLPQRVRQRHAKNRTGAL